MPDSRIRIVDDGFIIERPGKPDQLIRWDDVVEVITFKQDLITYDNIYLAFGLANGQGALVDEETTGFADLMAAANKQLGLTPGDWYFKVMQPPFKTNEMKLFKRPSA